MPSTSQDLPPYNSLNTCNHPSFVTGASEYNLLLSTSAHTAAHTSVVLISPGDLGQPSTGLTPAFSYLDPSLPSQAL